VRGRAIKNIHANHNIIYVFISAAKENYSCAVKMYLGLRESLFEKQYFS
jgi:hypothetical protein